MDNLGEARYGVSVLDLKHKKYAQEDEVMVRGRNGRMFYKRDDGQVVTYNEDYTKESLYFALNDAEKLTSYNINDYLVYNILDVPEEVKVNKNSGVYFSQDAIFPISKDELGFYIRVRGNDAVNSAVSYARTKYLKANPGATDKDVKIEVVISGGKDQEQKFNVECNFNELTFVPITITDNANLDLDGLTFPLLVKAFGALTSDEMATMRAMDFGNENLEATVVDLITFTPDVSKIVLNNSDSSVKLGLIDTMTSYRNYEIKGKMTPFILSTDKPDFDCVWAQEVNAMPVPTGSKWAT